MKGKEAKVEDISEKETRKDIDERIASAKWYFSSTVGIPERGKICREYKVEGIEADGSDVGFADYVAIDDNGDVLAVYEAKKAGTELSAAMIQAMVYATAIARKQGFFPFVYATDGSDIICSSDGSARTRKISGFHGKDEIRHRIAVRGISLSNVECDPAIIDRPYQIDGYHKTMAALDVPGKNPLICFATGTGKTRMGAAIVKAGIDSGKIKRVLWLCDRIGLAYQAKEGTFDRFLPNVSSAVLAEGNRESDDASARIVFATYQSFDSIQSDLSKSRYTIGYFDLVVVDEGHRSVFNKYKCLIDYFDCPKIVLTATPRDELEKSTFAMFGIADKEPTASYPLIQAVKDGFANYYRVVDRTTVINQSGITRANLSEEERQAYDDQFGSDTPFVGASFFRENACNKDTLKKMLADLMENGIRDKGGERLGKTIIIAESQAQAHAIVDAFKEAYPNLCLSNAENGIDFCVAILSSAEGGQDRFNKMLLDEFERGDRIRIAVSVGMLTTGIDVPDLANIVLFRQIRSIIEYKQIIGRGTRLFKCKDGFILSPSKEYFMRESNDATRIAQTEKQGFLVFDYCGNARFFNETTDQMKDGAKCAPSYSQSVFIARTLVIRALQIRFRFLSDEDRELYRKLIKQNAGVIAKINRNSMAAQPVLVPIDRFQKEESWDDLAPDDVKSLTESVALAVPPSEDGAEAMRFDLPFYYLMIASIEHKPNKEVACYIHDSICGHLLSKLQVAAVGAKEDLIIKAESDEFLNDAGPSEIESIREQLRELASFLEPGKEFVTMTDFTDEVEDLGDGDPTHPFSDGKQTFKPFEVLLKEHIETSKNPVYDKIRNFEPLSDLDVQSVQSDLSCLSESDRLGVLTDPTSCVGEARKSVGLSEKGIAAFRDELLAKGLSPVQASYACLFAESIRRNGAETKTSLIHSYDKIFSFFDKAAFDKVWDSLSARKAVREK